MPGGSGPPVESPERADLAANSTDVTDEQAELPPSFDETEPDGSSGSDEAAPATMREDPAEPPAPTETAMDETPTPIPPDQPPAQEPPVTLPPVEEPPVPVEPPVQEPPVPEEPPIGDPAPDPDPEPMR